MDLNIKMTLNFMFVDKFVNEEVQYTFFYKKNTFFLEAQFS